MTKFVFLKRDAAELHVGSAERSATLKDIVDRVVSIARMSATELAEAMGTEQGQELARLEVVELDGAAPESYLRPWNSIGRASPSALTDQQYDRFLRGEHPTADVELKVQPLELYGADLESEA